MKARRSFFGLAAAFFSSVRAWPQQRSASQVKVLLKQALSGQQNGMEATLVEVTIPPGDGSPAHRHPGFIAGYVLEGELRFAVNNGTATILKAGETFFEPEGAVHSTAASARPDAPVKILAFTVAKQGVPISTPA